MDYDDRVDEIVKLVKATVMITDWEVRGLTNLLWRLIRDTYDGGGVGGYHRGYMDGELGRGVLGEDKCSMVKLAEEDEDG